ncbi:hypothetical protein AAY473_001458 [Plecturocebus cupreus]
MSHHAQKHQQQPVSAGSHNCMSSYVTMITGKKSVVAFNSNRGHMIRGPGITNPALSSHLFPKERLQEDICKLQ